MKNMKIWIGLVLMLICTAGIGQQQGLYKVVYEADKEGNRISGSLEDLITYVDSGNPVRVGWELVQKWPNDSTTTMRHWTDGGFVTSTRGQVFAQIRGIFGQGFAHISGPPGIFLFSKTPNSWVAVIGTDGNMRAKFEISEDMKDFPTETIKSMENSKVKTMWSVMVN